MIASLRGTLSLRDPSDIVIETDGGTGYTLQVPIGVFERLPALGSRVQLLTELVVREDNWSLFGFDSAAEREVFRRLMAASGVGPRLALAILSTLGPDRTVRSIRERDLAALASVPGIGRKKAERIVLELTDRLDDVPAAGATNAMSSPATAAARALVSLGFPAAAAERAVRGVIDANAEADTETIIRRALAELRAK